MSFMSSSWLLSALAVSLIANCSGFHTTLYNNLRTLQSGWSKQYSTANPTVELGESIASFLVKSPLYGLMTKQAKDTMKKTAEGVGVQWDRDLAELKSVEDWETRIKDVMDSSKNEVKIPEYYLQPFHTYPDGNLCWEAAFEQELASKAVGARNFPNEGIRGEDVLRGYFDMEMDKGGVTVEEGGVVVDMGCGTGISTRKLAEKFTQAKQVIGYDLSPQMVAVGRYLNEVRDADSRICLDYADMADTPLMDQSVDLVVFSFIFHELPMDAVKDCLKEAYRVLKPGCSIAIMEMDPQAPGYVKLRQNPFLFSIIRSTEPYLDQWFLNAPMVQDAIAEAGFSVIKKTGPTGRHLAIVATKPGYIDARPNDEVRDRMDMHLKTTQTS